MHSYYIFELTLAPETENFNKLFNRVYEKSKGEYQTYSDNDNYVDDALAAKGITVVYHDNSYKKKIKLLVNPNWIRGDDKSDSNNISKSLRKLEARVNDYFDSKYGLNDFKLSKMGIVVDVDVHEREKVTAYLKIIKKVGRVKGFSPSKDRRLDNDMSFCLEGNSNGIEFMIYDLEKLAIDQQMETDSKPKKLKSIVERTMGILRVEVWLASKAIRGFTDETVASRQMVDLLENNEKILLDTFLRIIPFGDFYKKNRAVEIIQKKVTDRRLRRKMLRLLVLVPEKKSLLLAQKALNCRRINDVMDMFSSIEMSPVTISKRHDIKKLKNFYKYL